MPLICLTLTARTLAEDIALARRYASLVDMVELRADCLDAAEIPSIGEFPACVPMPSLLTVRRQADGGAFTGAESEREALFAAVPAFAYVDFESDFDPSAATTLIAFMPLERSASKTSSRLFAVISSS